MFVRNLHLFAFTLALATFVPRRSIAQKTVASAAAGEKQRVLAQQILELNNQMLDAEVRNDIPALDQFFADDFVRLTLVGFENKAGFLKALATGRNRFLSYEFSDVQIHTYGTIAVLAGGLHLKSANGDTQNLFADVWVLQDNKWRTLAWSTLRAAPADRVIPGDSPFRKTETAGLGGQELNLLKRNEEMFGAQARSDTGSLDQVVTADFVRSTAEGIRSKAEFSKDLKNGTIRFDILQPYDVKAHVFGDSALLTGGFRLKDSTSDTQNLFLTVWVRQNGAWRSAALIADAHPRPAAARP